jgi:hypothetical protein
MQTHFWHPAWLRLLAASTLRWKSSGFLEVMTNKKRRKRPFFCCLVHAFAM